MRWQINFYKRPNVAAIDCCGHLCYMLCGSHIEFVNLTLLNGTSAIKRNLSSPRPSLDRLTLTEKALPLLPYLRNFGTIYKSVRPNIPGDFNPQQHCCKKLRSRSLLILHRKVIVVGHKHATKHANTS
jgi:hypothetical protein